MKLCEDGRSHRRIQRPSPLLVLIAMLTFSVAITQAQEPGRPEMLVSTAWLDNHLHDRNLIVLCIVDEERFYSDNHIPDARMIRLSDIVITRDGIPNELAPISQLRRVFENAGIGNDSRVILYGERSGMLAARAYFTFDYLGIGDNAALLDGGIEKWRAERRQESRDVPPVRIGKLEVRAQPDVLVDLSQMAEYSRSGSLAIIDSRPNDEYTGEKLSEDVPKKGHIPRAAGLYWRNLLRGESNPELKSTAALHELFRASGATPDNKGVITYCRTGMQSSFSYFVAKYLGYKARMYDGSFYEWSRSSLPVEP